MHLELTNVNHSIVKFCFQISFFLFLLYQGSYSNYSSEIPFKLNNNEKLEVLHLEKTVVLKVVKSDNDQLLKCFYKEVEYVTKISFSLLKFLFVNSI